MTEMKHILWLICGVLTLMACSSEKKNINTYLENNYSDREISLVGDISSDSAFCPLAELENAATQIMNYRLQLLNLLEVNPDSAFKMARALNERMSAKDAFANMAYPKGKNNRVAYQVKCQQGNKVEYITFYKHATEDFVELSSLDIDDTIDSLMVSYNQLMNGISVILQGQQEQ